MFRLSFISVKAGSKWKLFTARVEERQHSSWFVGTPGSITVCPKLPDLLLPQIPEKSQRVARNSHPVSCTQCGCSQPSFCSPTALNHTHPARVKISPCPLLLCSSPPNCSRHLVSIKAFHLTLSSSQKALSPLIKEKLGQYVEGWGGASTKALPREKLGVRCWEWGGGPGEAGTDFHLLWQAARSTQMLAGMQLQPRGMQI